MARAFKMGGDEVWHEIRSARMLFTKEEWDNYLAACYQDESNRIRTTIGKYTWNDNDICLNPETESVVVKAGGYGYFASIEYAECGNGVWVFGYHYNLGTEGGCSGVSWADKKELALWNKVFENQRDCKKYAWRYLLTRFQSKKNDGACTKRLLDAIEEKYKQYSKPQIVQLELFNFE